MTRIAINIIACVSVIFAGMSCGPQQSPELESVDIPLRAKERQIDLDEVPPAVRETILAEAGGHKITEVEEIRFPDRIEYEAEWKEGGEDVELHLAADGTILGRSGEDDDVDTEDENTDDEDDETQT